MTTFRHLYVEFTGTRSTVNSIYTLDEYFERIIRRATYGYGTFF
jgi:hypothetical protein